MEKKKFYLTTAIAYTSRKPHIGNTYELILADAIVRYKRLFSVTRLPVSKDTRAMMYSF